MIRVLLVDDHRLVREALRDALARVPDIQVIGEAGDGRAALAQARELNPDVIVLDIGLPDLNGMELAARLKDAHPGIGLVALSAYADKRFVTEMLRAGAQAYVIKAAAGTELVSAIHAVTTGNSYFCPEVATALTTGVRDARVGAKGSLGRREREVLRLVAGGFRTSAIAKQLHIAPATVEVHRRNLMRKLDLHSVAALTVYAIREGIVLI